MSLINREDLIAEYNRVHVGAPGGARKLMVDAPEVKPERKTGKWILKDLKWECDQCGCRIRRAKPFSGNMWNYYYCPNCGAKMKKGEQE